MGKIEKILIKIVIFRMAPGMMTVKNRPNQTRWTLENGYISGIGGEEYPMRISSSGYRVGLVLYLEIFEEDLEYLCRDTGLGFSVMLSTPGDSFKISENAFRAPLIEDTRISIKPKITTTTKGLLKYKPIDRYCFVHFVACVSFKLTHKATAKPNA